MKNKVIIRNTDSRGLGLFANRRLRKGEVVVHGRGLYKAKQRTSHSFQINEDTHMQLDKFSRSINHSCDPNTGIRNNSFKAYDFIALQDINKEEEITWDYETTEHISISVKKCLCGSNNCRRSLNGFMYRPQELLEKYNMFVADYLKILYRDYAVITCTDSHKHILLDLKYE